MQACILTRHCTSRAPAFPSTQPRRQVNSCNNDHIKNRKEYCVHVPVITMCDMFWGRAATRTGAKHSTSNDSRSHFFMAASSRCSLFSKASEFDFPKSKSRLVDTTRGTADGLVQGIGMRRETHYCSKFVFCALEILPPQPPPHDRQ